MPKPITFVTEMRQFNTFFDCGFVLAQFGPKLDKFGFDLNCCSNWFDSSVGHAIDEAGYLSLYPKKLRSFLVYLNLHKSSLVYPLEIAMEH
jgi:hypothetical protein